MTGSQQHVAPYQYKRDEVGNHGLACPFAKSDPERYMNIDVCKPSDGFKEPRLLFEHIWRKHTRFFHCDFCSKRWSISTSRGEVKEKKEEHWKSCEGKRRGVLYFNGPDETKMELLDWKQQELFEKIRLIRDVEAKLEALYRACRKPVPETYHATAALPTVQPQTTYAHGGRATARAGHLRQSTSHGSDFLDGFGPVARETPNLNTGRTTLTKVSKATAVPGDNSVVSGADRSRDEDSGYGSKNNGDTADVSPAGGRSARPGDYWPAAQAMSPYTMSDNHHLAAASPLYVASDDDNFAPIQDHAGHDSLQGYDHVSVLFGLTLPMGSSGAEDPEGPVNIGDFSYPNAEFSVYPGEISFQ